MKKILVTVAALLVMTGVAGATVFMDFNGSGSGNMVTTSPVVYQGTIDYGTLYPGIWRITVPDASWPPPGNPAVRWAYIFANYYVYNPLAKVWTGTFPGNPIYLEKTGTGTMSGVCSMRFQILDINSNGIVDPEECVDGFSGAVIIIQDGTGAYAHLCGDGTYDGSYNRDCVVGSPNYMLDLVDFEMILELEECGMGTDVTTWGAVKALFE